LFIRGIELSVLQIDRIKVIDAILPGAQNDWRERAAKPMADALVCQTMLAVALDFAIMISLDFFCLRGTSFFVPLFRPWGILVHAG